MKKITLIIGILWIFFAIAPLKTFSAEMDFSIKPITNDGKKWRIGYLEGGPYDSYRIHLIATIKGLMEIGWVEKQEVPDENFSKNTKDLWDWFSNNLQSDYIEFVPSAYWSNNWDKNLRENTSLEIFDKLNKQKNVDLMIAMGTWAGQDMSNDQHSTPTFVLSVSNALKSGIIKSIEDSGYDHLVARVAPRRYERQVKLFHQVVKFKKLGVAYQNDEQGRTYAAIAEVEKAAEDRGFEIVACYLPYVADNTELDYENGTKCMEELASKVDAVYISEHAATQLPNIYNILDPLIKKQVPTFAQHGSTHVRHGVLLSIAQSGFKYVGKYYAETIAQIFNGAKPRELSQIFEDPMRIAINMKTASLINFDTPTEILDIADEIYKDIQLVE